MRHLRCLASPFMVALSLAILLQPAGTGIAAAKEGMMAELDAPIALDTPPGTEILVAMTVTALTDTGVVDVIGSPIVLILTGRNGATTEAAGATPDRARPAHYEMRIAIPEGGVRAAHVVIRGSSGGQRVDLDIRLLKDPFTFGGVTARTAQIAPAPTPMLTPFPRGTTGAVAQPASAPAGAPAAPAEASAPPAEVSATDDVSASDGAPWWPAALAAIALGVAVIIAVRVRFGRRATEGT